MPSCWARTAACSAAGAPAARTGERLGLERAVGEIALAVEGALREAGVARGEIAASAFALAGVDWPGDPAHVDRALEALAAGRAAPRHERRVRRAARRHLRPRGLRLLGRHGGGRRRAATRPARRRARWRWASASSAAPATIVERAIWACARMREASGPDTALAAALCGAARRARPRRPLRGDHARGLAPGAELRAARARGRRAAARRSRRRCSRSRGDRWPTRCSASHAGCACSTGRSSSWSRAACTSRGVGVARRRLRGARRRGRARARGSARLRERAVIGAAQARARTPRGGAVTSHMRREIARAAGRGRGDARGRRRARRRASPRPCASAASTAWCWSRAAPPTTSRSTRATCSRRAARSRRASPRRRCTRPIGRRSTSRARSCSASRSRVRRPRSSPRWSSPRSAARSRRRSRTRPALPLAERCPHALVTAAGEERSVAATKTFTTRAGGGRRARAGARRERPAAAAGRAARGARRGGALPGALGRRRRAALLDAEAAVCIARGYAYATALEAALKLKEVTGLWAEGFSAADLRHGPRAAASGIPALVFHAGGPLAADVDGLERELAAAGSPVISIGPGRALPAAGACARSSRRSRSSSLRSSSPSASRCCAAATRTGRRA